MSGVFSDDGVILKLDHFRFPRRSYLSLLNIPFVVDWLKLDFFISIIRATGKTGNKSVVRKEENMRFKEQILFEIPTETYTNLY